jgi:quercetin dioxygenase-like cupin family protein
MSDDVEILLGHPDSVGQPFVMRIRELPGTVVPPHSHPVDEHITVVSGTWYFGVGERFDSTSLRELPTGTYAFAPAGTTMFAASPGPAIVQIHGIGPFHIHWRDGVRRSDEPGADSIFRFRAGQSVAGPLGPGRVVMGYASGAIIQYEIERQDRQRYMAHQRDLKLQ